MDENVDEKIKLVDKKIDGLAKNLAGSDNVLAEKLKAEIKNIVLQNDLMSSSDEASSLLRVLSGQSSVPETETIIKAKESVLEINKWDIDSVRAYRGENLTNSIVEETKKDNPEMTDDQVKTVKSLAENVNKLYNSDGGIEDQKDAVLAENQTESIGKVKNAWNDTQGINGLLKQTPKNFDEIVKNDEQITSKLQNDGIKIPYQKFDKLASYDRVMNSIKNPEMRKFVESARSRFKTLDRITNGKFGQITNRFVSRINGERLRSVANNFFNKSIVKITNGFASKIGNQAVKSFVQNSMGTILKNGISGGIKTIAKGAMKKGVQLAGKTALNVATKMGLKAAAVGIKAAFGAATAGMGYIVVAAWEAIKLGTKLVGKLINSLDIGLTNSNFLNVIIITIIAVFVLLMTMSTSNANIVSSLKPDTSGSGGNTHGEITYTPDGRTRSCGVGMDTDWNRKSHNTWVTPDLLTRGNYDQQLETAIGDQYGKRCGVVYAAQYLTYDFDYWVPYYWAGKYYTKGINPNWGKNIGDDGTNKGRIYSGLDCSGFVKWVLINGYGGNTGSSGTISFGNCQAIKDAIQPGDTLTMPAGEEYHIALVLEYDDNRIKFAHAGGGSGVTTGWVDICSGKLIGGNMTFGYLHSKSY